MQYLVDGVLWCKCSKCGLDWKPKNGKVPSTCANTDCRSTIWDKEIYKHECQRCGNKWESTIQSPGCCPECKSFNWDSTKEDRKIRNEGDYYGKIGRPRKE